MTDSHAQRIAETQIGLLVGYVLRTRWALPVALVVAIVAAVAVEAYRRATVSTSWVSETVAIVRPQAAFRVESGATTVNYLNNPERDALFLPEPLSVVDYALLVKTQDVLEAVATAYNAEHGAGSVTANALRGYLQPVTKLELRTPYEVRYYPTMQLQVSAPSAELANGLATVWAAEAGRYCNALTQDVKDSTLKFVTEAYEAAMNESYGSESNLPENAQHAIQLKYQAQVERVAALSRILTQAQLAHANDTPEFKIASAPTPAVARKSGWPSWSPVVAFVVTFGAVAAAAMVGSIAMDLRRAVAADEPGVS